jgi:uroporphyrinogen-III decarboxylase
MTNIDIADARRVWGNHVAIWGGLASVLFSLSTPDAVVEAHIRAQLAQVHRGDCFVLGMGDNLPTDSALDRLLRVQQIVEERGAPAQLKPDGL